MHRIYPRFFIRRIRACSGSAVFDSAAGCAARGMSGRARVGSRDDDGDVAWHDGDGSSRRIHVHNSFFVALSVVSFVLICRRGKEVKNGNDDSSFFILKFIPSVLPHSSFLLLNLFYFFSNGSRKIKPSLKKSRVQYKSKGIRI